MAGGMEMHVVCCLMSMRVTCAAMEGGREGGPGHEKRTTGRSAAAAAAQRVEPFPSPARPSARLPVLPRCSHTF